MSLAFGSENPVSPLATSVDSDRIYRQITRRLIPILFISFAFAFLDRINVGYAQLQMKPLLGFTDAQYGLGAGMYFISTILFAVPGVMLIERIGVRLGFLLLMGCWGLAAVGNMFVTTPMQFYILRFISGLFECAFFPGIVFYLTAWYPSSRRARVTSYIMLSIQCAGLFGGPLSGSIMSGLDHVAGLRGWQWLFLLEGGPVIIMGVVCYFFLSNRPTEASWLSPQDRAVVARDVENDRPEAVSLISPLAKIWLVLVDPQTFALGFLNFATICAAYTFNFWLPTIIKSLGVASTFQIGLYSFIPYFFASLGVLFMGWSSDRARERRWQFVGCVVTSAVVLSSLPFVDHSFAFSMVLLCIFGFAVNGSITLFWSVLATYMHRERASAGIAFVGGLGGIAGFLSPTILGIIRHNTGSLNDGFYLFSAFLIVSALIMAILVPARAVHVSA